MKDRSGTQRQPTLFERPLYDRRDRSGEFRSLFVRAYRNVFNGRETEDPIPSSTLRFYPYTNLKNTLRVRSGVIRLRISDILEDAPPEVLEAAIGVLLARWKRRKTPVGYLNIYREHVDQAAVERRISRVRQVRGVKRIAPPEGKFYNLAERFDRLNEFYFDGQVEVREIGWSLRAGRRSLGHYDMTHDTIVINSRLDRARVPGYVVDYVLYHEMLHAWLGVGQRGDRCRIHPPEFKRAERRFADFDRAMSFIKRKLD